MSDDRMLRPCPLLLVASKVLSGGKDTPTPQTPHLNAESASQFIIETNREEVAGSPFVSRYSFRVF